MKYAVYTLCLLPFLLIGAYYTLVPLERDYVWTGNFVIPSIQYKVVNKKDYNNHGINVVYLMRLKDGWISSFNVTEEMYLNIGIGDTVEIVEWNSYLPFRDNKSAYLTKQATEKTIDMGVLPWNF